MAIRKLLLLALALSAVLVPVRMDMVRADTGDVVIDCTTNPTAGSDDCLPDNYVTGDPWNVDVPCTLDDSPVQRTQNFTTVHSDAAVYCDGGAFMTQPTLTTKIFWTTCDRRDGDTCDLNTNTYPNNPGVDSCDWCPKLYEKAVMSGRQGYCRYYWGHHVARRKVNGKFYAISDWRGPYRICINAP